LLFHVKSYLYFVDTYVLFAYLFIIHRVLNYMFTNSYGRLALCAYWICVICVSIRRFYNISKKSTTERILLRKYYHLVAVLIFSPAVIFQVIYVFLYLNPIRTFTPSISKKIQRLFLSICSMFCSLLSWTWHLVQRLQFS
jgi:hypothetical protein